MYRTPLRRFGAALAVLATVMTAQLALPAHADIVANTMTVQGNTFQVGQTYTVVVPTGLGFTAVRDDVLVDMVNGVAEQNAFPNKRTDDAGTISVAWTPASGGTHQLYITDPVPPTVPLAPATVRYGPVTVQVSGTPSDPTVCGYGRNVCLAVHGTLEAGCPLTLELTDNSVDTVQTTTGSASQKFPTDAQRSAGPNVFTYYDGTQVIATTTASGTTTATAVWTPTTSGPHSLMGNFLMPSIPSYPHVLESNTGWLYLTTTPAGTTPCA